MVAVYFVYDDVAIDQTMEQQVIDETYYLSIENGNVCGRVNGNYCLTNINYKCTTFARLLGLAHSPPASEM
jgi:hypothetical protein